jgi:outer membrane protein
MKRISCFYFFTLALLFTSFSQDKPAVLTLKQCVETALTNNFDVLQNGLQMKTAEIDWKQSKLNLLPDLNGSATHGSNQGRSIDPFTNSYINQNVSFASYGLNSGILLFQGLAAQNTIKQSSLNYQASKMDWQQAKDNLTINIILAYLQVLSNQDILEQARNQAVFSNKQVERLEILDKQGAISPSILFDLRGQYASDQLSIINAQNSLVAAKISLYQLMNLPYDKNAELEKMTTGDLAPKYETQPEDIYQTALQQFAQVKAADLRTQSAVSAVKAARGLLYPRLTLNGSANTNYSSVANQAVFTNTTDVTTTDYVTVAGTQYSVIQRQNNYSYKTIPFNKQLNNNLFTSVNLNLQIPIFNSFFQRNRVKLAKISLQNNELVAKTTKTQLQQSIELAYSNMISAQERYKTLLDQVNAYEQSFKAAEVRFNAGLGTSVDYLTAKNNLDRANINLISSKYDYALRRKVLDYYQGKPLW